MELSAYAARCRLPCYQSFFERSNLVLSLISALLIAAVLAQVEAAPAPVPAAEKTATSVSKITLSGKMTLDELRAAIEEQTGNKIIDYRQRMDQTATNPKLTLDIRNAPFWPAV